MVLQPCPNESGVCANSTCADPEADSHQWFLLVAGQRNGPKICRKCDRKRKAQGKAAANKRSREQEESDEEQCAGDTLVEATT